MNRRQFLVILLAVGMLVLLDQWGGIADRLVRLTSDIAGERDKTIRVWSNSGTPEFERRQALDFMRRFEDSYIDINFRTSGNLASTLHVSFMSGSPPDLMEVNISDMRDMVANGMLRPMTDLLERSIEEFEEEGRDFVNARLDGEAALFHFTVSPDDPLLELDERGQFKDPLRAARLLKMHGQFMGFTGSTTFDTVTYNKRVFREAAAWFMKKDGTDRGLVDREGNAAPPRTWMELIDKAAAIAEYGRRSGSNTYGIVVQGRTPRDIMRGPGAADVHRGHARL